MQPFELTPTWRIGTADRNFTLEKLSVPRKEGAEPTWKPQGFFARIEDVIGRWRSDYIMEHEGTLPVALLSAVAHKDFRRRSRSRWSTTSINSGTGCATGSRRKPTARTQRQRKENEQDDHHGE